MRMKNLRSMTVLIVLALVLAIVAGCQPAVTTTAGTTAGTTAAPTTTGTAAPTGVTLPLTKEKVTYTGFYAINENSADMNKNEVWAALSAKTNVYFTWESVLTSAVSERYKLMLASKQLPDLIHSVAQSTYPGGLELAVADGIYLDLKPLLPKNAPLYWAKLSNNASALRDALTDKGYIPALYQINELYKDKPAMVWGMVLRADWLKDLGLAVPVTIDDWYNVLTQFKTKKNCEFPLLWHLGNNPIMAQAFGVNTMPFTNAGPGDKNLFYPDANNKIRYGGVEQNFQDYLVTLSKWYKEGLFDRDFATRAVFDLDTATTLMGTGKGGALGGYLAWTGRYYAAAKGDPNFKLTPAPTPVLTKGSKGTFVSARAKYLMDPFAINAKTKNPELLLQFFNYLCTPEGNTTISYGIEGKSYTMVGGKPTLTDFILKSEKGAVGALEIFTGNFQPFRVQSSEAMIKQTTSAQTIADQDVLLDSTNVVFTPYQLNPSEGERLAEIITDINTYVSTEYNNAVMKPEVAAKWMAVQAAQIKTMKIDEAIAIVQGAYDRYLAKK
jgi:putative aldouronate transport system substrate-binding protein